MEMDDLKVDLQHKYFPSGSSQMNTAIAPVIELTLLLRIGYGVLPCTSLQCDLTPVIIRQQFVWLKTTTYEWGFEKLCWKLSDLLKSWKLQNKDVLAMIIQNNSNSKLCPYSFHHHAINLIINNVNNLTWYHLVLHMCKRIGLWTCRNCWRARTLIELAVLIKIHPISYWPNGWRGWQNLESSLRSF